MPGLTTKACSTKRPPPIGCRSSSTSGGIEHAILHLLYSRFYTMFLRDLGFYLEGEPYKKLLTQGMVCKESHYCPKHEYLYPFEVEQREDGIYCTKCGSKVRIGRIEKMSKSKKNVVDPDEIVQRYGADTTRLFCLSDSPPEKDLEWSDQNIDGCYRFLNRIWSQVTELLPVMEGVKPADGPPADDQAARKVFESAHAAIKKVTEEIEERYHLNTAISAIRTLTNDIQSYVNESKDGGADPGTLRFAFENAIILLYPFIPHMCEELWERLGHEKWLVDHPWPAWDESFLVKEEVRIVVQINGKVRGQMDMPVGTGEKVVLEKALEDSKIQRHIDGKELKKVIYVQDKLLSLVV